MKFVPLMGSPPIPTHVVWPMPARVNWYTISYVSVPDRLTTPTGPGAQIRPGMMPTFDFPGEMSPGQFGPSSRAPRYFTNGYTRVMSSTGTPSVMATMSVTPASAASMIASEAYIGGT